MTSPWSEAELERIGAATELEIAVKRDDGSLRRWTPIWVVCAGGQVYVRTWHRRDTGWFGQAVRSHRARIRVPGLTADVIVGDIGEGSAALRESVDTAYQLKYGAGSASMVSPSAVVTTLRLDHERDG
ncbi:MAG: DUF2255 family protein [Nakamurella sp.]